ncbi:MAG: hypothetical protein QOE45_1080 [Frankiaceae bacterium]|nr:hypothetical protein [Frankiaceae bacterium]
MTVPRRRTIVRALLVALAVAVLLVGWVGVRGMRARVRLDAARAAVPTLQDALSADRASVPARLAAIQRDTHAARRLTSDPVWRVLSHVPWFGRSLRTGGGLARAVDDLATRTFPDLDRVAAGLSLESLRDNAGGVRLEPLRAAQPDLARVGASVARTEGAVRALPSTFLLGSVGRGRAALLDQLETLRTSVSTATLAARLAPDMLGGSGVRRYFLAILNNAEMRGSGGFLGAWGILEADHGRLRLTRLGVAEELRNTTPVPATRMPPDFVTRYGRFYADSWWTSGNLSPHFPDADQIWTALWLRTRGERLDGTIAIDPVALSGLLTVTGPTTLPSGEQVTAANVVRLTERDAYARFATNGHLRDLFLQQVAVAVYRDLTSGRGPTAGLVTALADAAGSRHLQIASTHPGERALLETMPLAGVLPDKPGPYLEVTTVNAAGNKLDYYVRRSISYDRRRDGTGTVEVRLRNLAPPGLPAYVRGRLDLPPGAGFRPGEQHTYVSVFGAFGSLLEGAALDGRAIAVESELQRGHPVWSAYVDVDPGHEAVLTLRLAQVPPGRPLVREPPLVVPDEVAVRVR